MPMWAMRVPRGALAPRSELSPGGMGSGMALALGGWAGLAGLNRIQEGRATRGARRSARPTRITGAPAPYDSMEWHGERPGGHGRGLRERGREGRRPHGGGF